MALNGDTFTTADYVLVKSAVYGCRRLNVPTPTSPHHIQCPLPRDHLNRLTVRQRLTASITSVSLHFAMSEDCTVVRFSREPSSARIENLKPTDSGYPEKNHVDFGGFYVTCVLFSVITYIADLVLVCVLLYFYSIDGHGVYFALTLSFLIVPALLMTAFNFRW